MKKIIHFCFCILLIITNISFKAQQNLPFTPKIKKGCYTVENEQLLKQKYPKRQTTEEFEAWLAPKIEEIRKERNSGRNINVVYNIPVVIHIVHNGDAIGTGENITNEQAISQITVMNEDYRKLVNTRGGANTTGLAVDCEINFCLAQTDPNGNLTTGIVRHNIAPYTNLVTNGSGGPDWELRTDVEAMKAVTKWDPNNYLNMWTIRSGGNALDANPPGLDGLLGYAQFPSSSGLSGLAVTGGTADTDGVVASFDAFGTEDYNNGTFILNPTYNLGRTMTHEVGHWLGLRHIWGDNATCPNTNTNTNKDFCADTPAANGPNYVCNLTEDSCTNNLGLDQLQNYMDYTNDACMDTFTNDQKLRMIAVMTNSPRRNTLNASLGCQTPTPLIKFEKPNRNIIEETNCNFTDYNFAVVLGKPATQNATVTFNANVTSTATNTIDFAFVNPSVTFIAGSTTPQNLVLRVFHDGFNESNENITIDLSVNANGGNAALNPLFSSTVVSLKDNDLVPVNTQIVTLLSENLDVQPLSDLSIFDLDGDTLNWQLFTANGAFGFAGTVLGSRSRSSAGDPLTPDNLLVAGTLLNIPANTTASLTYKVGSSNTVTPAEKYAVYITPTNDSATIVAGTPIFTETLTVGQTAATRTINLNAFAGQSVYLSFRHFDCSDQGILIIDDIKVDVTLATNVQTSINTATAYQATLNSIGTAYARDTVSNNVIADLNSSTNFNYGCVNTSVSRDIASAGAPAVNYGSNTQTNKRVMAKVVSITTQNPNANGTGSLKFYFTETEIAAWEAATGNLRSALRIIKAGNTSFIPTTLGAFGAQNVTLSGNYSNGIGGVYYFGTESTLSSQNFDLDKGFVVYPNPTKNILNIEINGGYDNITKYSIVNNLGQTVRESKINSEKDLSINTSNLSNGIYFIKVEIGDTTKVVKFIKE